MGKPENQGLIDSIRSQYGPDVQGNTAVNAASAIGDVADVVDPNQLMVDKIRQAQVRGPARAGLLKNVKASRGVITQVKKAAMHTGFAVRGARDLDAGDKEAALGNIQRTKDALGAKADPAVVSNALQYGGHKLTQGLGVLDAAHRQLRNLTTPGRDPTLLDSLTGESDKDVTTKQWNEAIRSRIGKLERPGDVVSNVLGVGGYALGAPLGLLGGTIATMAGEAANMAEGKPPSWEAAKEAYKGAFTDAGDIAREVVTDPLNLISLGGESATSKTGQQALKLGRQLGIEDDVMKAALGKIAVATKGSTAGPKALFDETVRGIHGALASKVGDEAASRAMQQAFGQNFEFLGRQGLKLGIGKASVEIPVQKGVKQIAESAAPYLPSSVREAGVEGASNLFRHDKDFIKAEIKRAKVVQQNATREGIANIGPRASKMSPAAIDAASVNIRQAARSQAQESLKKSVAAQWGDKLPEFAHKIMDGAFDESFNTVADGMRKMNAPAGVIKAAQLYGDFANTMKRNVLVKRLVGYHALNGWNDSLQMFGAGMNNPAEWILKARGLLKAARKGEPKAVQFLQNAQRDGIAMHALDRVDLAGNSQDFAHTVQELKQLAKGGNKNGVLQKIDGIGDNIASSWDDHSKLAMYMWGVDKGEPSWRAAKGAYDALIDYGDRSKGNQIARWFLPFVTYMYKFGLEGRAAEQIAARPGRIAGVARAVNDLSGDTYNQTRSYIDDQGMNKALPGPLQRLYGAGRQAVGGSPLAPGEVTAFQPKLPWPDVYQPEMQAARWLATTGKSGSLQPAVNQLGQGSKALAETLTGHDLITGDEVNVKPFGLVPSQLAPSWVPQAAQIGEKERGLLPNYFANYIPGMSPGVENALNFVINKAGGPGAPVTTLGYKRDYSYDTNPNNIAWRSFIRNLTGVSVQDTMPEGASWNAAHSGTVQRALNQAKQVKKVREETRKRRKD